MPKDDVEADQPKLERAFSRIEEGSNQKKQKDYWKASQNFVEAHSLLQQLAQDPHGDGQHVVTEDERKKFQTLYSQQAKEYFDRARQTLVQALDQESTVDRENVSTEPQNILKSYASQQLTDEEAKERMILYASLFSREQDVKLIKGVDGEEHEVNAKPLTEQTLEERLRALNKSVPSKLKSDEERMRDINQGMNRLGMNLFSHADHSKNHRTIHVDTNKSELEQVEDLIAQAKDEAQLAKQFQEDGEGANDIALSTSQGMDTARKGLDVDDVFLDDAGDSDLEDESDEDDDSAAEIPKEQLQKIQEKINEAQSSLAQLNALLAAAQEEDTDVQFDQNSGKKALKDARVTLQQATDRWRASLM